MENEQFGAPDALPPCGQIVVASSIGEQFLAIEAQLHGMRFEVVRFSEGARALAHASDARPALAILDMQLAGMSGLEVLKSLRSSPKTAELPVVLLLPENDEVDRVLAFEFGADDCLLKPFSPRELALRVRGILRHKSAVGLDTSSVVHVGPICLDNRQRQVTVDSNPVALTEREYRLLLALIGASGRVLSRETLLKCAWRAERNVEIRTVDTHLHRLREKLGNAGSCIQTARGFGYCLSA